MDAPRDADPIGSSRIGEPGDRRRPRSATAVTSKGDGDAGIRLTPIPAAWDRDLGTSRDEESMRRSDRSVRHRRDAPACDERHRSNSRVCVTLLARVLVILAVVLSGALTRSASATDDDTESAVPRVHALGLVPSSTKPELYRGSRPPSGGGMTTQDALPTSVDNSSGLPPVGDQGAQNSCGPWSVAYYLRTYQEKRERGWSATSSDHQFSPAFIYNQVSPFDVGTTFDQNLNVLLDQGCATLSDAPYDDADHTTWPSHTAFSNAIPYRIASYTRLGDGETAQIIDQMKTRLAGGDVCLIGFPIWRPSFSTPGLFESLDADNDQYDMPADDDIVHPGGHAVAVVGYDDDAFGGDGGFKVVNSWGTSWGNQGFAWMSYRFVRAFVFDVYVVDDRTSYSPTATARFEVEHWYWSYDRVSVTIGVGSEQSPLWSKRFLDGVAMQRDHLSVDMEVDVTEGAAYLPPTASRKWWIKVTDAYTEDVIYLRRFDITYGGTTYSCSLVMPLYGSYYGGSELLAYLQAGTAPTTTYYVNDGSTTGDVYCTAVGNDANAGTSASAPKATVQSVIDDYVLRAGDTVYVDAGTYALTSDIRLTQLDRGASGNPIRFAGAIAANGEPAAVFDRGTGNGACFTLSQGARFIQVENLWLKGGSNGVYYDGIFGTDGLTLSGVRITNTSGYACSLNYAGGVVLDHCRLSGFSGYGIYLYQSTASLSNCSIAAPTNASCLRLDGSSSYYGYYATASLSHSVLSVAGSGRSCVVPDSDGWVTSARFNDFFATGGATIGFTPDSSNLSSDPLFADPANGDLHLKSSAGRWDPAASGGSGAFVTDSADSPCIDAADFAAAFSSEGTPNGGRANLGAFGGTAYASKSASSPRYLFLDAPTSGSTLRYTRPVTWHTYGSGWQTGDTVRIEFSTDGGTTWTTVSGASALSYSTGSFAWDVTSLTAGTNYVLRIVSNQDGSVAAATTAAFAIDQPTFYYVNDGSTTNDVYCSATGNDANDGLTAATPKATLQAILSAYDLEGGDVVYVDTGTYTLTSTITIGAQDGGDAADPVRVVGSTDPSGTIVNRNSTSSDVVSLSSVSYVWLEGLRLKGGRYGAYIAYSNYCGVIGCRVYGNSSHGISMQTCNSTLIDHNVVYRNGYYGISGGSNAVTVVGNTICGNSASQIWLNSNGIDLSKNVLQATQPGTSCFELGPNAAGIVSDYNDFHATGGAAVGNRAGSVRPSLSDWQAATGLDAHSLSNDPLLVDPDGADNTAGNDDDDLHLQSTAGSWHGGSWSADAATSPCIDAGDPSDAVGSEPSSNGSRINLGAYGGTTEASKTPSGRVLSLVSPNGAQIVRGNFDIVWATTGAGWAGGDTIRLEVSADGGTTWSGISGASSLAYTAGRFTWNTTAATSGATFSVRATSNQDSSAQDASETRFTVHNTGLSYYVNDGSTTNDVYCSATGSDANDGLTAATPKATVQAILSTYDLEGGDVVYVDTGTYTQTSTITIGGQDGGDASNRVRIVGSTHPSGTVVNRNSTGADAIELSGASYVSLERLQLRGGRYGVYFNNADLCAVADCRLSKNAYGAYAYSSAGMAIQRTVLDNNTSYGLYLTAVSIATCRNTTFHANGSAAVFVYNGSSAGVFDSVLSADGSGRTCIYFQSGGITTGLDYNCLRATNGAAVGYSGGASRSTLADWQASTGRDAHSLSADPLFVDADGADNVAGNADDDFHLQSTAGSWHGGAWSTDSSNSPCIDAGDPSASVASEPSPAGGRINLGAYGGTSQASKTPSGRVLTLVTPTGTEILRGSVTILWQASGSGWSSGDTVRIEASTDGGSTWSAVSGASALGYTAGSFTWDTTAVTSGVNVKVRITCNQSSSAQSASANRFTVHNAGLDFYVNDASTTNDVYCSATGSDANDGLTAATPKATVQAILSTYDLEGGDVVYVDTGTYTLTSTITIGGQDGGDASNRVRIVGSTHPSGTVVNRNSTGADAIELSGASYVSLERLQLRGGRYGVYFNNADLCAVADCRLSKNAYGAYAYSSADMAIQRTVLDNNTSYGLYLTAVSIATCRNTTFHANGSADVFIYYGSSAAVFDSVLSADGANRTCIQVNGSLTGADFNCLRATNGAAVGYSGGASRSTLADWQASTGRDAHSLSADPLFVDADGADNVAGNADDDFHLQSTAGSWHGGSWSNDSSDSPCIDAGDPDAGVGSEPSPSGGRVNLGAYGGTAQASKCYYARRLVLIRPDGGEFEKLTSRIRWSATGSSWASGDTVALSYSTDSGSTWQSISGAGSVAASAGSFDWDLTGLSPGTGYRVKLVFTSDSSVNAASAGDFTVGGAYYVNDSSATGDAWCSAAGNDSSDGRTPSTPKASLQAILDTYDLDAGDTVFVDAGTYTLTADVTVASADGGSTAGQVRIVGVPGKTILDRNAASSPTAKVVSIGASYVSVEGMDIRNAGYGLYTSAAGTRMIRNTVSGCRTSGIYAYQPPASTAATALSIERNTVVHAGTDAAIHLRASSNVLVASVRNNTVVSTGASAHGLRLHLDGGTVLRNNLVAVSGTGAYGIIANIRYSSLTVDSEHNDIFAAGGAKVGLFHTYPAATLDDWRSLTGCDLHSISADPLFANASAGDYHLKSAAGRYDPSTNLPPSSSSAWVTDSVTSLGIDAGDPDDDVGAESSPNGGRINLGAYGGTAEASRSPTASRRVTLLSPNGSEVWRGTVGVELLCTGSGWSSGDTVYLEVSADGGSNWSAVSGAGSVPYTQTRFWWDTRAVTDGSSYLIRATATQDTSVGDVSQATFTVANDDTPGAVADSVSVVEDNAVTTTVLANDTGLRNTPLTLTIVTAPSHGQAVVNANQTITYTPSTDYSGTDSYVYRVTDYDGDTSTATVSVSVSPVNDYTPQATADVLTTAEDTAANVAVLTNDTGLGDLPLGVSVTTAPAHGTTSVNTDLSIRYTPTANYNGSDSFVYRVSDRDGQASTATVSVTVTAVNDAPVVTANTGSLAYTENQAAAAVSPTLTVSDVDSATFVGATVAVTANFVSGQDVLSFTDQNGITGSYGAATGVLTLTGSATVANYQAALRTVAYSNASDNPSTLARSVTFTVNDGGTANNLASASRTVTVTAVNDAPVLTATAASLAYAENQAATAVDGDLVLTDADSANLTGATVSIIANLATGQDVLSFTNQGGITGSYNAGTGVLTLTGTAAVAVYQTALRSVAYANSSDTPSVLTRTVRFSANDGAASNNTGTATRTVTVTPVNDAPVVTATVGALAYVENQAATAVDAGLTVTDIDSANLVGATVAITANLAAGEDVLAFTNQGGISGSFNASTGVLTLSGTATLTTYRTALRAVTYANTSDSPSAATRTVTFTADDGGATSNFGTATRTITVTPVNDAPVITATAGALAYVENQAATAIDAGLTVADVDSANLVGATVAITANLAAAEDVLAFATQGGITGSYSASTGVLTLTGTATVAAYQAALRTVSYANSSESPSAATRTVTFTADDGGATSNLGTATRTITVTPVNDAPVVTATAGALAYVENQAATAIDAGFTVSDVDGANLVGATVAITANLAASEDVLAFTTQGGITGSFNATTGVLTLSGTATLAAYQTALRTVTYANTSENPFAATRTVTFTADDGSATSNLGSATRAITVTPVNDAPVVTTSAGSLAYVENQAATAIDAGLTVADVDSANLVGATVAITANLAAAEDVLAFTNQGGITGTFNASSGVLTLSGTATVAAYQAALRTVTYANSSDSPSAAPRTVTFTTDDGGATSNLGAATRTITVTPVNDAPVVTATVGALAYVENQAATAIDAGLTVTDVDSTNLVGATVAITANLAAGEDVLAFTSQGGITGSYSATTGVLTLSGTATVAAYQAALRTVTYANTSESPSAATRTVTFTADDGGSASNLGTATRTITVTPVNDAPVVTATAGARAYVENQAATAIDAGLTVTDTDSANLVGATVAITANLAAGEDVLAFTNQGGITGSFSASTGVLTLSGTATVAAYQTALRTVSYANSSESPSAATRTVTFTADDGGAASNFGTATRTITVTPVNDAPVVTATAGALAYVENQAATALDAGLTVSDVDSANLVGATVAITANLASGEDVLAFTNQGGISGSFNASTGVLTLSGTATLTTYRTALRAVTYANTSDSPSAATRTVTFTADDGGTASNLGTATRTITVTPVNDAPVVTATVGALAYLENQAATAIDAGLTVTDIDSANLVGATVAITANLAAGEDVLAFTNQGGITGSFSASTGVLTLSGTATVAAYQAALRTVTYANTSESPSAATRTVTFTADDGSATSNLGTATRTITVTPVNDAPVVTATGGALAYAENQAATAVDVGLTVTDIDSASLVGATVAITANFAASEDVLAFTNQGGITGSYSASTGVLTLTGTATVAAYQAALRTVSYANSSDSPSAATRAVTFTADDGGATSNLGAATRTITVTPVNDAPVVTATAGALAYVENQAATAIDAGLTVSDVDSANLVGATVAITANFAASEDVLAFTNQGGITGSFNAASGVLTLTGTATVAAYQAALRTVSYANSSDSPSAATRTVTFTADDGGSASNLGTATRTITVTPVNDAPVVTATAGALAYVENQAATAIDAGLTVTDIDSANLVGATVAITANLAAGEDVLAFTNQGGITGSYSATTGVLTLSGTAALTAYQTALRTVTYANTSDSPSAATRTVTLTADDGSATSNLGTATRTITVTPVNDAPVVTATAGALAYVENQAAAAIDSALTVADVDSANLVGATVAITANFAAGEDVLAFANQGGISGSYSAASGVLTLSGTATVAAYQAALRTVTYANTSDSPSAATRTVTFTADDGSATSNLGTATRTITVTPVNDAPVVTATAGALAYVENQAATAIDAGLTVSDVDSANLVGATVAITANLAAGEDVLAFATQGGITGSYSASTGVLTLTGTATVAAYQAALRTVSYANSSESPSAATRTVTFTADDGGTTSNLGTATRTITVTPVNDAPVVTATAGALAYLENQAATAIDAGLTVTDIDSANLVGATVAITANIAAAEDVLAFTNQGGITGSYSASTGVLTLTGAATVAAYQTALRTVTYANTSDNPSAATRTVTFTADDGSATSNLGSATRTITVTPVNDAPVVTATAGALAYVENQAATAIDAGLTVSDVDSANLVGATVAITANLAAGEDVLAFATQGGITGSYSASTGVLTLTGTATVAAYQAALRTVSYANSSESPSAATRTVTFTADDGGSASNLGTATRTITVTPVNDAPVVTATAGALAYVENQAATAVDAGLTVTDIDSANLVGATVAITANLAAGEDVLAFTNQGGISGSYSATTGVLTLTGTATVAAYQAALRTVTYANSSDSPSAAPRTVTFTTDDGGATSNLGTATRTITVTPVNDAPVVTATAGALAYLENQAATAVDAGLTVADVDSANLVGATVAITANFAAGEDVLAFTNQGGISGSFSASTGVLTLTGTATVAAYQAALRTVSYANSSESPSAATRTVTFTADDGGSASNLGTATRTITVTPVNDAPVAAATAGTLAYVENQAATAIDAGLTVADVDSANLVGATVAITANLAAGEDVLAFTTQGGIAGSYNAGTGVLTLSGTATVAAYQAALRTVTYANTSDSPSGLTRTVTFTADDGGAANRFGTATRTVKVTPVNDAPVLTAAPGGIAYVENQAPTAIDPDLTATDVDSPDLVGATVAITANLAAGEDVLAFTDQGGIAGSFNASTGVLTLSGTATVAAYQTALRTVTYANTSDNPSALTRTVTITIDDGSAAENLASATRTISVTPVNDAPTFVVGPDQFVAQELGPQTVAGFVTDISPGSPDEAGQVVDFLVTVDRPELFDVPPAIAPDGTLTYTPAPDGSGTAVVTVRLHDDGGTADGGADTSAPQTFRISVTTIVEELGAYNGLALPAADVTPGAEKTGLLDLVLSGSRKAGKRGTSTPAPITGAKVKGRLQLGTFDFRFTGTADNAGVVHFGKSGNSGPTTLALKRRGLSDLTLSLTVDASQGTDQLAGTVLDGTAPYATITADRALYTSKRNPAPPLRSVPAERIGTYTVVFGAPAAEDLDPASFPRGNGFGTLTVDAKGFAKLSGWLADGTRVKVRNALSKSDRLPVWIPLAKGQGAVAGYVQFASAEDSDLAGPGMLWFRPASGARLYPQGWPTGITTDLFGSGFDRPPKSPASSVLPGLGPAGGAGNAELRLLGGGLGDDGLVKVLDIDPANRVFVFDAAAERVTLKITPANGQFRGTFVHPATRRKTTFQGVILQKQAVALGYFLGPDEAGAATVAADEAPDGR